jgi:predicted Zn-dependent peptidase
MQESLTWHRQVLPNGVRVLTYPKPSSLTVQLAAAVEYGANDEPDEHAGAAHFLEHMVPGGSETKINLSREIERLGGLAEFFTNHEYTLHTADVLPNKLVQAAKIVSALLFDGEFEEEKFRKEQKIILQELAEAADDPNEQVNEMLLQSLFRKHPVRRPIGGYPKTVRALTLHELAKIHNQNYVPQKLIVVLSGNYSNQDAESTLNEFAQKIGKPAPKRQTLTPEVAPIKKKATKCKPGLVQSYLSVGARTTHSKSPNVAALDVLNVVLGVGASSRLFIELREKRAFTYSVSSSQTDGLDFGFFSVDCALKQKHANEAERIILRELSRIRNEDVPVEELNKGKDVILGDIFRAIGNLEVCPEILAFMEIQFGNEHSLVDYTERVKAVTGEDVREVAEKYLREENLATAILAPKT